MKLAHSSDWHLGKTLYSQALIADQAKALEELKAKLRTEKVDVLLLSGDIFDRSVPPEDAVSLLDQFLTDVIRELKIPVCLIPGNHDSNTRLGSGAELLKASGLHIFSNPESAFQPLLFSNESTKTAIFGIPYLEPGEWGAYFRTDSPIRSHDEALELILNHLAPRLAELKAEGFLLVLMLHAYVLGGAASDSERPLSVGGSEVISADRLKTFDYVALGHLHRPQSVGAENIRYSGSLFPYSQSESNQDRGFVLVDWQQKDNKNRFRFLPFTSTRKLKTMHGSFEEILSEAKKHPALSTDDYVIALITDRQLPFEASRLLSAAIPNLLHIGRKLDWDPDALNAMESGDFLHRKLQQDLSDHEIIRTFVQAASTHSVDESDVVWLQKMFDEFRQSNKDADMET